MTGSNRGKSSYSDDSDQDRVNHSLRLGRSDKK